MKNLICTDCGSTGKTKKYTPGSWQMELLLLILGIVPGLIYNQWRISNQYKGCSDCGGSSLIPVDSPCGKIIYKKLHKEEIDKKGVPWQE